MSKWFRVYDDLIDDPKVQRLPAELFKALINLWCLASQNGGVLPSVDDIAYKMRIKPARAADILRDLRTANFIDDDGDVASPHNWSGRQYMRNKGEATNSDRQRRYKERKRNGKVTADNAVTSNGIVHENNGAVTTVSVTAVDTEQIQNRTDLSNTSCSQGGRSAPRPAVDQAFEEFWRVYPRRDGANPRAPAAKKFAAALKAGSSVEEIVAGARAYRTACDQGNLTGTPMVAQALTWLNQRRWSDYGPPKPAAEPLSHGRDPPDLPPEKRHFYRWFSQRTPEGLPPEQWQAFAEGRLTDGGANEERAVGKASLVQGGD